MDKESVGCKIQLYGKIIIYSKFAKERNALKSLQ